MQYILKEYQVSRGGISCC